MRYWLKYSKVSLFLTILPLLFVTNVDGASLGKVEVASHISEPFYAEVPLQMEKDEAVSKVFIEIANSGDYRIFEVYRDSVLNALRADVVSDKRGTRIELTSNALIKTPFFNLILKIRTGRVSYFRKYPVFMDVNKTVKTVSSKKAQLSTVQSPEHSTKVDNPATRSSGELVLPAQTTEDITPVRRDSWARSAVYGPIVSGDSLYTVARRLRADHRYSIDQVMLALFEKNPNNFDKNNINLLKAGGTLKVPSAADVERNTKSKANRLVANHSRAWNKLTKEPHYAAVAEAQRSRYNKRVGIGKKAEGSALAPVSASAKAPDAVLNNRASKPHVSLQQNASKEAASVATGSAQHVTVNSPALLNMQLENKKLQQQLDKNSKNMKVLQTKLESVTIEASTARLKKLEILIARLQSELEKKQQNPVAQSSTMDWIVWVLIALVLLLMGIVVRLLRREPVHPAAVAKKELEPSIKGDDELPSAQDSSDIATVEDASSSDQSTPASDNVGTSMDSSEQVLDPDIDYITEADVYIRYGMDSEALEQLNMALRLQADNVDAYIKKAQILYAKDDKKGLDEVIAVASGVLVVADLATFNAAVADLSAQSVQEPVKESAVNVPEEEIKKQISAPLITDVEHSAPEKNTKFVDDRSDGLDYSLLAEDSTVAVESDDKLHEKKSTDDTESVTIAITSDESDTAEEGSLDWSLEDLMTAEKTVVSEETIPEVEIKAVDDDALDLGSLLELASDDDSSAAKSGASSQANDTGTANKIASSADNHGDSAKHLDDLLGKLDEDDDLPLDINDGSLSLDMDMNIEGMEDLLSDFTDTDKDKKKP
ncbi:MAG: FimV/HubP family polar landmark protein [Mariprofundus sp.]|nr:FimV/HubP family polar landmark protein [Mariprofundus sp.]